MDPYTRARTVRIGKWRWPPPKEELAEGAAAATGDQQAEGFFEFKMRKLHQKMSQSHKENSNNQGKEDSFDTSEEIQSKLSFIFDSKKLFEKGLCTLLQHIYVKKYL